MGSAILEAVHFVKKGLFFISTTITLHNISFQIEQRTILQHISGTFEAGKITTLVGPSGAGKTTLLKLCNGLLSPTAGSITINDKNIAHFFAPDLRKLVGMALQAAPMITGTVYDNLNLPKKLQGTSLSQQQALQYLSDVNLPHNLLQQQAHDLSGGQRQRVSIARTLVNNSAVLLLDEITSALDRHACRDIEQLIVRINKKYNTTIIWITHNLQQAMTIGHHTWMMQDGKLIERGNSALLRTSQHPLVRNFVDGDAQ